MSAKGVHGLHVASLYAGRGDVPFSQVLNVYGEYEDTDLAELIEQDGRMRVARQLPTTLERYLSAIPDLLQRRDALDAAIDVTLRWMAGNPRADQASIDALVAQYPDLEEEILDAASLSHALMSTAGLQAQIAEDSQRSLPHEFGPPMDSGECRYQLQELLGVGGFGEVYKAVDRQLSEEGHPALVAVKILNDRSDPDGKHTGHRLLGRPRLLEEATKARRVNHPNVVRVLDRGVTEDDAFGSEAYIVYDFIDGGDLDRWIAGRAGPMPVREAASLVARIARGVQAAHSAGLVHCDLKPGNIILTAKGEPKVADFGIAVRFGQPRPGEYNVEAPDADHPIGNVAFISPEQYRMDEGALTVPSDIYALGGILFLLLTGTLPNGSSHKEIARTHDRERGRKAPPAVSPLRPEVDLDLEAICQRAMALRPENRYSAAGALADDLESWLRSEPLYWTKPSALRVVRLWARRKPAVAVSWALVIVSVLASVIAVTHFARRAAAAEVEQARAEMEAEVARIREAEAAARQRDLRNAAENLRARVTEGSRTTAEVFSLIWIIEHVLVPRLVAPEDTLAELQLVRFQAVRAAIDQARREGREDDLDTLLWKTMLAFWMVGAGDAEEAVPMLQSLEARWSAILHPTDRWLGYIQAIKSCGAVVLLAQRAESTGLRPDDVTSAHELAEALELQEQIARRHDPKSAIHLLIIENMQRLYGPSLIDNAEKLNEVNAILVELGMRVDYERR